MPIGISCERKMSRFTLYQAFIGNPFIHYVFDIFSFCCTSGASGNKSFTSKRYLARGGQIKEGVTVLGVPSTYYWRPVDKTNFTVGIVLADSVKDEMLANQSIPAGTLNAILNATKAYELSYFVFAE